MARKDDGRKDPIRTFRASDEDWDGAMRAADDRGEVLSEELRRFLRWYRNAMPGEAYRLERRRPRRRD